MAQDVRKLPHHSIIWLVSPAWNAITLTLEVGYICPSIVNRSTGRIFQMTSATLGVHNLKILHMKFMCAKFAYSILDIFHIFVYKCKGDNWETYFWGYYKLFAYCLHIVSSSIFLIFFLHILACLTYAYFNICLIFMNIISIFLHTFKMHICAFSVIVYFSILIALYCMGIFTYM